jgi:hypothetical protein
VLAYLLARDPSRRRFAELATALAESHLDLYRASAVQGTHARLEPLRGGPSLSVRLTGPFLRHGDQVLARVLSFDGQCFVADSPYLLKASEAEWLAYLERATGVGADGATSAGTAPKGSSSAKARLSAKQLARRRKQQEVQQARQAPDAAIRRHLQRGLSERYWLDYFMDGYAGQRRGIGYVAGVPDRPETLPHHRAHDSAR